MADIAGNVSIIWAIECPLGEYANAGDQHRVTLARGGMADDMISTTKSNGECDAPNRLPSHERLRRHVSQSSRRRAVMKSTAWLIANHRSDGRRRQLGHLLSVNDASSAASTTAEQAHEIF